LVKRAAIRPLIREASANSGAYSTRRTAGPTSAAERLRSTTSFDLVSCRSLCSS
jgi:hypothetical protein